MITAQTLIYVSKLILKKTWYIIKGILLFLLLGGIGFIIVWQYYDKGPWKIKGHKLLKWIIVSIFIPLIGPIALALILVLYPKSKQRIKNSHKKRS